jgi:tetratricopeptide (TPR) repeat protein
MDEKELRKKIGETARTAKSFALKGEYDAAREEYKIALSYLSGDIYSSEYAVMLFCGIGETYFSQKNLPDTLHYFQEALKSEGGLGDPSIHFRLGQIRYEMGEMKKAKDEFMRAYMGSGDVIFEGEDPKYRSLIKSDISRN